jgi:hypothetical protein
MNVPSSGLTAFTQSVLNTTVAQAAAQVTAPAFNLQGTSPGGGSISPVAPDPQPFGSLKGAGTVLTDPGSKYIFSGPTTYVPPYGSASATLTTPGITPAQNAWGVTGAQATQSGAAGSTANGLATLGIAQGNCQNPSAMQDVIIPNSFALIYNQLLAMAQYTYRI